MKRTRRTAGRGRLSLRSRLLAGLIAITALFLIVMGVVTTFVIGNSEQRQFNSDLVLATRVRLSEIAGLQENGYAVVYCDTRSGQVGALTTNSATSELVRQVTSLASSSSSATWLDIRSASCSMRRMAFGSRSGPSAPCRYSSA